MYWYWHWYWDIDTEGIDGDWYWHDQGTQRGPGRVTSSPQKVNNNQDHHKISYHKYLPFLRIISFFKKHKNNCFCVVRVDLEYWRPFLCKQGNQIKRLHRHSPINTSIQFPFVFITVLHLLQNKTDPVRKGSLSLWNSFTSDEKKLRFNEIILRCKKSAALFQTHIWEKSIFF